MKSESEGLVSTPVEAKPVFHVDWFAPNIPLWELLVKEHLSGRDKFLEIGSFEGRSACWMLEHALAPKGVLYCVDTWEGSPEFWSLKPEILDRAFDRFTANVNLVRQDDQQVIALKNRSVDALAGLIDQGNAGSFDLIYVDGGHTAAEALADACMAWPLLRSGGLMIFDDYTWDLDNALLKRPKMAIDAFTSIHNDQLRTISVGHQYVVTKI